MNKRITLLLLIAVVIASIFAVIKSADEKSPVYNIAVINYSPAADAALDGLKSGLQAHGYHLDENYKIIYEGFIRDKQKLKNEAKRLVALKPDLIYSMSTPATLAVKEASIGTDIPIVFGPVSNPVKAGIVKSMKYPGGNITGITFGPQEPRRLEILNRIDPKIKKLAVPYNSNDKAPRIGVEKIKQIASDLELELILLGVTNEQELDEKLFSANLDIDAIFAPTDSMMASLSKEIADFAISKKIPYSCPHQEGVYSGAFFSYGFSINDLGSQAARIVHMILSGTKPSEIPVEISDFRITINLSTAEKIDLEVPEYLLNNAFIIRQ